jgi:DNA-directed RNA polymerase subunit RPC12/RpoP
MMKGDTMGTSHVCERCGKEVEEAQSYEHLGRAYCEDCYMDILSPPKACDPWAVYTARSSLQGEDKFSVLTGLQCRIVGFIKEKGEATAEEIIENLNLTEQEFKREFAVLRHMEVLRGTKKETKILYTLFNA